MKKESFLENDASKMKQILWGMDNYSSNTESMSKKNGINNFNRNQNNNNPF
jgi:hypothetical protein